MLFQGQFNTNYDVAFASYLMAMGPDPDRLPVLAALGDVRRHARRRQVVRAAHPRNGMKPLTWQHLSPTRSTSISDPNWWRQAVVYQIYPRSFADSNGDGIGDLAGITSRVPYLASLGVDAVWLSPFYPSALADGGYDVDDYRDVDPRLGTLADFDEMIGRAARAGHQGHRRHRAEPHLQPARLVPSRRWPPPPGSPARDRYIFRDGTGPDGSQPPTDWQSMLRRLGLGPGPGRPVVPAPVRRRSSRT